MLEELAEMVVFGNSFKLMQRLKAVIACVMLAFWVPASMHCLLEDAGWLPKDESCASSPTGTHDQGDGCQFENGRVQLQALKVSIPSFDLIAVLLPDLPEPFAPLMVTPSDHASTLAELVHTWQFTHRAALPVRAPSILS
jgi:hypothetical protein